MSLPRFFLDPPPAAPAEGLTLPLGAETARHLKALRLRPGAALELVLDGAAWRADLAELDRDRAL
ncbi:MAG: 16S rRNA (uracil(1498)-N(3))-methyltransferase, partial [Acidobacteriota bacterium]|nr:16S rRNA (uracil(1498)-N(3))-methyltransferase [Acidobacteriota bacterium]